MSGTLSVARYSAYSDLSAEGYLANAAGDIARNNGALQVTLNADLLDGVEAAGFVSVFGGIVEGDLTMTYAAGHKFLDTSRGIGELNLYEDDSLNPGCRTVELDGDYGGYLYLRDDNCVGTNAIRYRTGGDRKVPEAAVRCTYTMPLAPTGCSSMATPAEAA